jgi:hypothetical protein
MSNFIKSLYLILAVCFLNNGCSTAPDLVPRILEDESPRSLVSASTNIVAGTITRVREIAHRERLFEEKRLRLMEISIRPDAVFKGSTSPKTLSFYRYDCVANCRDRYAYQLQPGYRYIFLLVAEGTLNRSTQDVHASFFPVAHTGQLSVMQGGVLHSLARAVLQPGNDADAMDFANTLFIRRAISNDLVGREQTIYLLKPLLHSTSQDLRRETCFALAEAMHDYEGCLARLVADTSLTETQRNRVKKRLVALTTLQGQLHSVFLTDPVRWLEATAGTEDPRDIHDLLRVLMQHPDSAVREQAVRMLQDVSGPLP